MLYILHVHGHGQYSIHLQLSDKMLPEVRVHEGVPCLCGVAHNPTEIFPIIFNICNKKKKCMYTMQYDPQQNHASIMQTTVELGL